MLPATLRRLLPLWTVALLGPAVAIAGADATLDELSKRGSAAFARQDYPAALAASREGSRVARAAGNLRRAALFENYLCGTSFAAMDFSGSLRACGEAVRIALLANESEIAGVAELNRSNFLLSLGDTTSAEIGLSRALSLLKPDSLYKPITLTTLGTIESRRGRYDAARRMLTAAAALAAASPDRNAEAFAHGALGALELHTKRYDAAEEALLANYRLRRLHRLPLLEGAWRQLGELRLLQGKPEEAIRFLQHGLAARKFSRSYYTSFLTWEVMGRAFQEMGERAKARQAFRRALLESQPWRDEIAPAEGLEITADVRLASLAVSFSSVSRASGSEAWEAFESIELTRAAGLRRQLLTNRALGGRIPPEQLELVCKARNLRRLVLAGDGRAASELRAVEFRLRRLESESGGIPFRANATGRPSADPERLASILGPGQVLISFLAHPDACRIWVLSRERRASAQLPELAVLSRAVEAHRSAILAGRDAREEGRSLYRLLFSGIPQELLDHTHWSVVADGPLWSVPWAALVPPVGGGQYLVEKKSLDLLPSATWLLNPKSQTESTVMLAAGNAIHNRADARFRPARLASPAVPLSFWVWPRFPDVPRPEPVELPGLAGSRRELSESCRTWTRGPCILLSGNDLTIDSLAREISRRPAVVHLATHLLDTPTPVSTPSGPELGRDLRAIPDLGQAFLALSLRPDLTREIVQPSDVSRFHAPGSLIVLSACGSGQGTILPGAGLQGFGRAWLASGARGVVATLWSVSDETSGFFSRFYTGLSIDHRPAQALRSAQLQALRSLDWQSRPKFWAAYMLLGKD